MIICCIPAYNEENTIGSIVLKSEIHVDQVIVVDDGSTDSTAKIAKLAGATVISHTKNRGYGKAIKSCFQAAEKANADILVILDSDGQHNPDEIPKLISPILEGSSDIVIGSRFLESSHCVPLRRQIGIKLLTIATNIGSSKKVSDSQSGFRAFSKKSINQLQFDESGMGVGSEIITDAYKKRLIIREVPITCLYITKISSRNPFFHGTEVLSSIMKTLGVDHPLLTFGTLGGILILIGVFYGIKTIELYNLKRMLPPGNALLTVLFLILGFLSINTAILLFTLVRTLNKN